MSEGALDKDFESDLVQNIIKWKLMQLTDQLRSPTLGCLCEFKSSLNP